MINFNFTKECYSCSACANICPKNAITFDDKLFPKVDISLCMNCGRCEQVCIKLKQTEYKPVLRRNAQGYVCKNIDDDERLASSSGGVFILLAKNMLSQGGYVCGCVYDDNFMPKHIVTNDFALVKKMMGSKYVKSDMNTCIRKMEFLLKAGVPVLFTGVPCQTAAVKNCLEKYSNLVIVNIVCHGSIDRDFWKSYLDEERMRGEIIDITMRDKSKGWDNYGLKITFLDGKEHITYKNQDGYFLRCFTSGLFQRERCMRCHYKGTGITGDFLLGDGWGMDELFPNLCDAYGVSSVVILSDRGETLMMEIHNNLLCEKIDVSQIVVRNKRIVSPAPNTAFRKIFQEKCRTKPVRIKELCEKYANPSFAKKIINKIYSMLIE